MNRRSFLTGFVGFLAAPAIVRVSSLMPVKAWGSEEDILRLLRGRIVNAELELYRYLREAVYQTTGISDLIRGSGAAAGFNGFSHSSVASAIILKSF